MMTNSDPLFQRRMELIRKLADSLSDLSGDESLVGYAIVGLVDGRPVEDALSMLPTEWLEGL